MYMAISFVFLTTLANITPSLLLCKLMPIIWLIIGIRNDTGGETVLGETHTNSTSPVRSAGGVH